MEKWISDLIPGDWVRMWYEDGKYYVYGEVILIGSMGIKVMFGSPLYDYGYYKRDKLDKLVPEDFADDLS